MDMLLWGVVFAVGAFGVWRAWRRRGRARQLMLLCHRADLEFSPIDPFPDTLWLPFRWLGDGRWSRAENVVWNRAEDDGVRAFDLLIEQASPSQEAATRTMRRYACAVVALPVGCPRLEIRPSDAVAQVSDVAGSDIELELEAFNRRFRVRSEDRRFAVAFCDQRMMRAMLGLPSGVVVAVNEDRMLLRAGALPAAEVLLLFEAARAMRRAVPDVVADLYPPRPAKGRHEDRWLQGHWSAGPTGDDAEAAPERRADHP